MPKTYTENALLGRLGVNLIENIVTRMGWVWNSTTIEAGIDGFIEIRDVASGRATNFILQVQSKARTSFQRETDETVELTCEERDLEYWLSGNAPVILVLSRPEASEAYWIDVKTYFRDPTRRRARLARFSKRLDRFDSNARERLERLAMPKDGGVYLAAPPRQERIRSNLVEIPGFSRFIYTASTEFTNAKEVRAALGWEGPNEWIARGGRIVSFCSLESDAWTDIAERGSVEQHDTTEWARSTVLDRVNEFRELLQRSLRAALRPLGIHYYPANDYFFFTATSNLSPRRVSYQGFKKSTARTVFQPFISRKTKLVSYYRHAAFSAQFVRFSDRWYLAITPTYHFTSDGVHQLRWYESQLQGIRRLERNAAVLGQVAMWAAFLRGGQGQGWFAVDSHIKFGALVSAEIDAGINEAWWLSNEEDEGTKESAAEVPLLSALPDDGSE